MFNYILPSYCFAEDNPETINSIFMLQIFMGCAVLLFLAELAFSTRSSIESDVYSYGVILLELLTKKQAVDPSFPDNMDIVGWVTATLNGTDQIELVCDSTLMEEV